MKKPDILAALEPLVEVLEKMVIPYYIGGSLCSSAFGIARATLDVDPVSDLRMEHASIKLRSPTNSPQNRRVSQMILK